MGGVPTLAAARELPVVRDGDVDVHGTQGACLYSMRRAKVTRVSGRNPRGVCVTGGDSVNHVVGVSCLLRRPAAAARARPRARVRKPRRVFFMHSLLTRKTVRVAQVGAGGVWWAGIIASRTPVARAPQAACTAALVVVAVTAALLLSGDCVGPTRGSALAAFWAPVVLGPLESVVSALACRVWPPPPSLAAAHDPLMNLVMPSQRVALGFIAPCNLSSCAEPGAEAVCLSGCQVRRLFVLPRLHSRDIFHPHYR